MLTNSPLDLLGAGAFIGGVAKGLVLAWLLAALIFTTVSVARAKGGREKLRAAGLVLGVMLGLPALFLGWQAFSAKREHDAFMVRYEKAEALFKKRCESAGETIHKTIPDVKGIVWMKWKPLGRNNDAQFQMDDPYGSTCSGDWCIRSLLVAVEGYGLLAKAQVQPTLGREGFEFVEAEDPESKQRYRYTLRSVHPDGSTPDWLIQDELLKTPITEYSAHYGITWDDVSTREDRENWVAGGSMSVVDLTVNEIIAERVGYMMDPGLGSTSGFRSPWGFARDHDCQSLVVPGHKREQWREVRDFAFKVLRPSKGETK